MSLNQVQLCRTVISNITRETIAIIVFEYFIKTRAGMYDMVVDEVIEMHETHGP
jgi:hypothetical protein